MNAEELASAVADLESNLWSLWAEFGRADGGSLIEDDDRLVLEGPVTQPVYNAVLRFRDRADEPLEAQVEELLARFRSRGAVFMWVLHPTTAPGTADALAAAGLTLAEPIQGMAMRLADLPPVPPAPADVEVIEAGPDNAADWITLARWRYGVGDPDMPYLQAVYNRQLTQGARLWVARLNGEPVSKVVMHRHGEVAGIYGVATREEGRGKGLASILTLRALHAARDAGATRGVLHSTPMARTLYERMGFRDVAPFDVWAAPDSVHL